MTPSQEAELPKPVHSSLSLGLEGNLFPVYAWETHSWLPLSFSGNQEPFSHLSFLPSFVNAQDLSPNIWESKTPRSHKCQTREADQVYMTKQAAEDHAGKGAKLEKQEY